MSNNKSAAQIADELLQGRINQKIEETKKMVVAKKTSTKQNNIKTSSIKNKFYYDVKIECMLPATVTYRILAEDAIQAAELIKTASPISIKHKLFGKKDIKLAVYKSGTTMLEFVKNLMGM